MCMLEWKWPGNIETTRDNRLTKEFVEWLLREQEVDPKPD